MWIELLQNQVKSWNQRVGREDRTKIINILFIQGWSLIKEEDLRKNDKVIGVNNERINYEIQLRTNTLLFWKYSQSFNDANRYGGFEKCAEIIIKDSILGGFSNSINTMTELKTNGQIISQ